MNNNKFFCLLTSTIGVITLSMATASVFADATLEYKLALAEDGKTYQVWMKPSMTPKPDFSLSWGAVSKNHYKGNYGDAISCRK